IGADLSVKATDDGCGNTAGRGDGAKEGLGNLRKGQRGIRHDDMRRGDFGEPSVGKEGSRCGGPTHLEHPIPCEEGQIGWACLFKTGQIRDGRVRRPYNFTADEIADLCQRDRCACSRRHRDDDPFLGVALDGFARFLVGADPEIFPNRFSTYVTTSPTCVSPAKSWSGIWRLKASSILYSSSITAIESRPKSSRRCCVVSMVAGSRFRYSPNVVRIFRDMVGSIAMRRCSPSCSSRMPKKLGFSPAQPRSRRPAPALSLPASC